MLKIINNVLSHIKNMTKILSGLMVGLYLTNTLNFLFMKKTFSKTKNLSIVIYLNYIQ